MILDITREQFEAYEEVRKSGETNMFDIQKVKKLSSLSQDTILDIMDNYSELVEKFKE